jgi:A/G-specific adenine glycosylase
MGDITVPTNIPRYWKQKLYDKLTKIGEEKKDAMPWYSEKDPFKLLVAEKLLQRTTRACVSRIYRRFIKDFGTVDAIYTAPENELYKSLEGLGLGKQRTKALKTIASVLKEKYGGIVPNDRNELLSIPHIGDYIADAVLLYAFGKKVFPLDGNVQRVLRRVYGLPPTTQPPYYDGPLKAIVAELCRDTREHTLKLIHRALLWLGWGICKGTSSRFCNKCPLAACVSNNCW